MIFPATDAAAPRASPPRCMAPLANRYPVPSVVTTSTPSRANPDQAARDNARLACIHIANVGTLKQRIHSHIRSHFRKLMSATSS